MADLNDFDRPVITDNYVDCLDTLRENIKRVKTEVDELPPPGGTGNVAADAIFDAKGDLPVGTGPDAAARVAVGENNTVLAADSTAAAGVAWKPLSNFAIVIGEAAPTVSNFNTVGAFTWVRPAGCIRIRVRVQAAGSGGTGAGGAVGASVAGGNSSFGGTMIVANGGPSVGPPGNYPSSGGGATINAPAVGFVVTGGPGQYPGPNSPAGGGGGGAGGVSYYGGGGQSAAAAAGIAGTVPGVGGGGAGSEANVTAGSGGAAGGYAEAWINMPAASYAVVVGLGGASGAGTRAGGQGGAGRVTVEEFYGATGSVADTQPVGGWPYRNRIINGDFRINQRNAGAITSGFFVDRWGTTQNSPAVVTCQWFSGAGTPPGYTYVAQYNVTTGHATFTTNQYNLFNTGIEGYDIADFAFGSAQAWPVTLSFTVECTHAGTFGGALSNGAQTRGCGFLYTVSVANAPQRVSVTIPGDVAGAWTATNGVGLYVWFAPGAGPTMQGNPGEWRGSQTLGCVGQTNLASISGARLRITGVQLEKGSVATEFERVPFADMLERCMRHYEAQGYNIQSHSPTAAGQAFYQIVRFAVPKPTDTPAMAISDLGSSGGVVSASIAQRSRSGFRVDFTSNAALANAYSYFQWSAESGI